MRARVVLIEDEVMFRSSLALLLQSQLELDVIGAYGSGPAFFEAAPTLGQIDLALVDIELPGEDGIALTAQFERELPGVRVILLSSVREDYVLHRALRSHAAGFVHKDDPPETLAHAIKSVIEGGAYFGQTVQRLRREMAKNPEFFDKVLSEKEQEVLRLIGSGLSNEEAAPLLALSPETVQSHRKNIMRKLGLHSAVELQAYALKHGFTSVRKLR